MASQVSQVRDSRTEAFGAILKDIQSYLGNETSLFLDLVEKILLSENPRHIDEVVIKIAVLLKGMPSTFYKLNPLFQPHARVDLDPSQEHITSFVLKTLSTSRIVVLDPAHKRQEPFRNLTISEFREILVKGGSEVLKYKDLETLKDTPLQACFAQLAQNLIDERPRDKFCRKKALEFLRRPVAIPPSFYLYGLEQHEILDYTGFSDLYKGALGNQSVVIKKPRVFRDYASYSKTVREIVLFSQLQHENILHFLGAHFDEETRMCSLVTPYMKNGNIIKFLEIYPTVNRLTPIWQIMKGLQFLHHFDPPIAHRDIKGANILVNDALICCLSDFGLSSIPEISQRSRERTSASGTFSWMAPEVISPPPQGQVDLFSADIYSLGITILEIYNGTPPPVILFGHKSRHGLRDSAWGRPLPSDLLDLVSTMVEFDPSERFSIRVYCQALEDNDELDRPKRIEGIDGLDCSRHELPHANSDNTWIKCYTKKWLTRKRKERILANTTNVAINSNMSHRRRQALLFPLRPKTPLARLHGHITPVTAASSSRPPTATQEANTPIASSPLRDHHASLPRPETPDSPLIKQPTPRRATHFQHLSAQSSTGLRTPPDAQKRNIYLPNTSSRLAYSSNEQGERPSSPPKRNRDSLSSGDEGDDERDSCSPSLLQRLCDENGFRSPSPSKRRRHGSGVASPVPPSPLSADNGF